MGARFAIHGNRMASFSNLGALIRRDRDPSKVAILDLGGEKGPREFTYGQLDVMANGVARGNLKLTGTATNPARMMPK